MPDDKSVTALPKPTHKKDTFKHDETTDVSCTDPCTIKQQASCYANPDTEHPNKDQYCGYQSPDGTMMGLQLSCCTPSCPSEHCPDVPPRKPTPLPPGAKLPKKGKIVKAEPLPKLLKMLLIILAILLVSAGIFISVG